MLIDTSEGFGTWTSSVGKSSSVFLYCTIRTSIADTIDKYDVCVLDMSIPIRHSVCSIWREASYCVNVV